ncbi:hypothetical protein [Salinimicrobium sp. TH3]|uniref:hypothetical protein n=1 Tax=Salinimicrobium sp. TH3 TaxID=2997342 RepID=UPI002275F208|nr:hypothetical protein [Salinimicrobium sp. TH3]MCY2686011.1 hypothetical protein [Salinimicrobium sp. TH3]
MKLKPLFIFSLLLLMVSCSGVYVSDPLPVDSKNIYSFPAKYRGVWVIEEDTIIIKKDIIRSLEAEKSKLSTKELDSSYIIKDNKIYLIGDPKKEISRGFPFKVIEDTIYFLEKYVMEYPLGTNTFLRKIKNDHIVNIKEQNQWWSTVYLKKDSHGTIHFCLLDIEKLESLSNHKKIYSYMHKYGQYDYFELKWTKKELLDMIQKGVFSDTLMVLELQDRIDL